ncbi:acyl-coenzyme A synthetase ACSM4, mitochondrial-like isoform X2 [Orbicella faveolata]|uniref:acyl-coenzyme A synthetase ACSM4, mitochondrial-like isoform X2 n=1 Tax=Orbicella faveolata TaxID=48498 RepID=UPI0009E5371E|nr:acyl-coenzyme A synthetase ACSM4, mitochondrial-like isoform X2 [Orbicella faveolata]
MLTDRPKTDRQTERQAEKTKINKYHFLLSLFVFFMWFFLLFVILSFLLFVIIIIIIIIIILSCCLCLSDSVTVFYRPGIGIIQSDLCWFHSSTGWAVLLVSAISSWSAGAGIFAHYKDIEAREALEILQTFPITSVFFLPRIYIGAVKEDLKSFHFPSLSSCITTGEPMNKEVMLKWKEKTGIDLREAYGQTELGPITCTPRNGEHRIGSVGPACHGVDVVVIDDNNQELCPGKIGKIVVRVKPYRPVGLFSRYVDDAEKTAARFSGDFYITGDLGYKDEDGYFWIVGRTDDIIFVNGVNINPYIVEKCLISHQAVLECAVVSSPDPLGQTSVKAFVVLSSDFKNKEQGEMIKELQDYVTKKTGAWMSPRENLWMPFLLR